jgi:NAD(P)-dependent dehydrogenase (short-subunit alcohol dehydrogenase family)
MKGRVVVVTGASSGIGRAAALRFADHGAALVLFARREAALDDVAGQCRERGADTLVVAGDVTDAEVVDRLARTAAGRFGRIDVWVNNAAVNLFAPIEEAPVALWHRVVETNLFGTYHGMRAALPWMREQGHGVVINVASVLGRMASPYQSAYVASKYGIRGLSNSARQELRELPGVAVCAVLPGPIDTPLFHHAGNYSGRAIKPIKPVIDADRVAKTIVSCAIRPRREVAVGASSKQMLGFARLVPGLVERIAARQVARDHFADGPAGRWDGNLLEPLDEPGAVSGGWSRSGEQVGEDPSAVSRPSRGVGLALAGAAGAAGAASAAVHVARSRRG